LRPSLNHLSIFLNFLTGAAGIARQLSVAYSTLRNLLSGAFSAWKSPPRRRHRQGQVIGIDITRVERSSLGTALRPEFGRANRGESDRCGSIRFCLLLLCEMKMYD